jgi:hypothetical protein
MSLEGGEACAQVRLSFFKTSTAFMVKDGA